MYFTFLNILLLISSTLSQNFGYKSVNYDPKKQPGYSEDNYEAPLTYPGSVVQMEILVKADHAIYGAIKEAYFERKYNFTSRQRSICKDFIGEYEKVPKKLRNLSAKHPLLTYMFIRRYVSFPKVLLSPLYEDLTEILKKQRLDWPQKIDLTEAIDALIRLQDFYEFDLTKLRRGQLLDNKILNSAPFKLNAQNFLEIGNRAIQTGYFAQGIEWLEYAQKILLEEDDVSTCLKVVEGHLSDAYMAHDYKFKNSDLEDVKIGGRFFNHTLLDSHYLVHPGSRSKVKDGWVPLKGVHPKKYDGNRFEVNFRALCRGEELMTELEKSKLFCSTRNYYMRIRVEMLSNTPFIIQIYDVINETSVGYIKDLSSRVLKPSRGAEYDSEYKIFRNVRTSYGAYLSDNTDVILDGISRKIRFITGFETLPPYEDKGYQIGAYPPGGHFIVHADTVDDEETYTLDFGVCGDRIATFMVYLSDVEMGGQTAFVQGLVAAKPVKGSAVLWFNKRRNGLNDPYRFHAGCPVIVGHKWITNKWICYNGQFNRLPCTLDPEE